MEEIEVPTESVQEDVHRHAEEARERWITLVAVSTAILAVFAAVAALLAGHHSNEAMIEQIQSSNLWAHYQAKSVKSAIHATKDEVLTALGKRPSSVENVDAYKKEQDEIAAEAHAKARASENHLAQHVIVARAVTMFQIAIAVSAISILLRRRAFWFMGLCFGVLGLGFLLQGLLSGAG